MPNTYVCPVCNAVVAAPVKDVKKKGVLLCPAGHKVHQTGLAFPGAFVAGLFVGCIVWIITWYAPGWVQQLVSIAMLFRLASVVYWLVLVVRGLTWIIRPNPTRGLGVSSLGMGLGAILSFGVTGLLYYMHFHKLAG
jgi:hypothetical protein